MADYGSVITAMVTPFDSEGRLDVARAGALARRLVDAGSDGIVVAGTTGESPTLTEDERAALLAAVLDAVGDRVFVWMGTGTNDTATSIRLSRAAEHQGAHGVMLVAPYYNKPPQAGMLAHFRAVAEATSLPVMIYNVPGRTASNLEPATLARLVEQAPNVVAVKEASGNLDQVGEVRRLLPRPFRVYSGDDSLLLPILAVGGDGVVSVASHLVARELRQLVDAFRAGRVDEAAAIHLRLLPLFKGLFWTANPIPVKTALRWVDFDAGGFRPPLVEMPVEMAGRLRRLLVELELLPA
ncbi:4-hydroxy-tetrahydrodipicolinate synthase [Thermaerobacter sp. PB12/4term]|uniref:4-hydroxy-tetrahydrodipicolinate synthase n=1 Tax=Thermaerobacter sp. PB12/4term TaxID=2293838 RepID=UPI000E328ED9|nr:4-hydroxy-tetrahydrodipicolinate synthase [Thermaerobacter sp. PB12/4term]QIA26986.1 4-hydroxy-tetrahydrodipicolinate synthase [Thermaerobacter sp. PB12/4term]